MRVRDNTQSNFMTGLKDVMEWWLDLTFSGQKYREQYTSRWRAQRIAVEEARAGGRLPPADEEILINTTRFPRGPGTVPNLGDQFPGVAGPRPRP